MLNEIFICCPNFFEILKFVIDYIFNFDLSDKDSNKKEKDENKFLSMKFTMINFVKEADFLNLKENNFLLFNLIAEKMIILQVITLRVIRYLTASLIFYHKIIQNKNLENSNLNPSILNYIKLFLFIFPF